MMKKELASVKINEVTLVTQTVDAEDFVFVSNMTMDFVSSNHQSHSLRYHFLMHVTIRTRDCLHFQFWNHMRFSLIMVLKGYLLLNCVALSMHWFVCLKAPHVSVNWPIMRVKKRENLYWKEDASDENTKEARGIEMGFDRHMSKYLWKSWCSTVLYGYFLWEHSEKGTQLFCSGRLVAYKLGTEAKNAVAMSPRVYWTVKLEFATVERKLEVTQSQTFDPGIERESQETLKRTMEETTWEFSLFRETISKH